MDSPSNIRTSAKADLPNRVYDRNREYAGPHRSKASGLCFFSSVLKFLTCTMAAMFADKLTVSSDFKGAARLGIIEMRGIRVTDSPAGLQNMLNDLAGDFAR